MHLSGHHANQLILISVGLMLVTMPVIWLKQKLMLRKVFKLIFDGHMMLLTSMLASPKMPPTLKTVLRVPIHHAHVIEQP